MNVDLTKLPEYLQAQRWFAGKAWPIKRVELVDTAEIPGAVLRDGPAMLAVLEVLYELGHPERYLLPVESNPRGELKDASGEAEVARALLRIIREGHRVKSGAGELVGERIPGSETLLFALSATPSVRQIATEQSNTSVVFDEKVILKLIRKLEAGVSPEHEVGRFLMTRTSFRQMPELLGALHLEGQSTTTAAVLHRFVPDAQEGWGWVLQGLRGAPTDLAGPLQEIGELGRTLAQLHLALGSVEDDPAFSPEPIRVEDLQSWSSSIVGELGVTLSMAQARFPELLDRRDALVERAKRLDTLSPEGMKIRIHGDLHLGQVLRSQGGWLVFDFEGEPARPFSQRRAKHSPLKDVAGMLRSFSYATATLQREQTQVPPQLEQRARQAFLEGYFAAMAGSPLLPASTRQRDLMLDALELEKVLYEVRYEVNNRPDWAQIPVSALNR
ncbi:MAG: phosphotransferase [Myxococcota bacterium]|nr:phosphotransferase [Myxococcota bacterium]